MNLENNIRLLYKTNKLLYSRRFLYKPFIVIRNHALYYNELLDYIKKMTSYLAINKIKQGDRIIIISKDDITLTALFLAILSNGVTSIILDPEIKEHRLQVICKNVNPKFIFIDNKIMDSLRFQNKEKIQVIKMTKILIKKEISRKTTKYDQIILEFPSLEKNHELKELPQYINSSYDAYILFTSGTLKEPKGVRISYKSLFTHIKTLNTQFNFNHSIKILNFLLLFHADGLIQGPLITFINQGTLFRPYKFELNKIDHILGLIKRTEISHFITVPSILKLILLYGKKNKDCFRSHKFKFIISAAGKLEDNLWKSFQDYFKVKIINLYGLTETVTGSLFCGPSKKTFKIGTIGKPIDCKVKVIKEDGNQAQAYEIGELLIKGDHLMSGYLNSTKLTSKVLKNGWLYTGDLVEFDNDYFFIIHGRKKNTIISGGYNIQPEEVCEIINSNSQVIDSICLGIEDIIWGEILVAVVEKIENSNLSEFQLIDFIRKNIEPKKIPKRIFFIKKLPRGPSGKILSEDVKNFVNSIDLNKLSKVEHTILDNIYNIASKCFNAKKKDINLFSNSSNTNGWDSISHLNFITCLENHFSISLNPAEIVAIININDVFDVIKNKTDNNKLVASKELSFSENSNIAKFNENKNVEKYYDLSPIQFDFFYRKRPRNNIAQITEAFKVKINLDKIKINDIIYKLISTYNSLIYRFDNELSCYCAEYDIENYYTLYNKKNIFNKTLKKLYIHFFRDKINISDGILFHIGFFYNKNIIKYILLIGHHLVFDTFSWNLFKHDFFNLLINPNTELRSQKASVQDWVKVIKNIDRNENEKKFLNYWERIDFSKIKTNLKKEIISNVEDFISTSYIRKKIFTKEITNKIYRYSQDKRIDIELLLILNLFYSLYYLKNNNNILIKIIKNGRFLKKFKHDFSRTIGWLSYTFPLKINFKEIKGISFQTFLLMNNNNIKEIIDNSYIYSALYYIDKAKYIKNLQYLNNCEINFNYLGNINSYNQVNNKIKKVNISFPRTHEKEKRAHDLIFKCYILENKLYINLIYNKKIIHNNEINKLIRIYSKNFINL